MITYEDERKRKIKKAEQWGDYYRAVSLYEYNGMYGVIPEIPVILEQPTDTTDGNDND